MSQNKEVDTDVTAKLFKNTGTHNRFHKTLHAIDCQRNPFDTSEMSLFSFC